MASKCCCSGPVVYLQAYFVTIATILGTGILGLPVTLSNSGLYPFLVTFIIDAIVQSLLVCFFVDLLQRAVAAQNTYQGEESLPLNAMLEEDITLASDDNDDDGPSNGAIMKGKMLHIREIPMIQPPNLHLLGKLFLGCGLAQAFDVIIILQFIALLICYALAGSEAFAQLIGVNHFYVIPVFVWVLTLAIVFALQLIRPVVSLLTFIKGSLLLGTAVVTFYVGLTVAEAIHNDFTYVGAPFLMGTVAIGGVINTMPYTFEKVAYKRKQIFKYHLAVQMGLWTCVFLNIIWCWTVLEIVPQTVAMACMSETTRLKMLQNSTHSWEVVHDCTGELSLESAATRGEISTIPLTKLLQRDHPHFFWVAILIEVFIMVSISVSYLTIGTALHHTLNGIVQSIMIRKRKPRFGKAKIHKKAMREWCLRTGVSLFAFSLVFTVAMVDPEGFIEILEKLVSFTLNAEVGFFVFIMLLCSRRGSYRNLEVPLPVPSWIICLMFLLPLFFNFAVFYDIYDTVMTIVRPQHQPGIKINATFPSHNYTFTVSPTHSSTDRFTINLNSLSSNLNDSTVPSIQKF